MANVTDLRPARIVDSPAQENGFRWTVVTDDGDTIVLCGLGTPQGRIIGDTGFVRYVSRASCGFFAWVDPATSK